MEEEGWYLESKMQSDAEKSRGGWEAGGQLQPASAKGEEEKQEGHCTQPADVCLGEMTHLSKC